MKVIASQIIIRLTGIHSLKEKRSVRESLIRQVQNKFKISIAECDSQDDLNFLTLGFAAVSNSNTHLNSINEKVIHFIETHFDFDIIAKESYWL